MNKFRNLFLFAAIALSTAVFVGCEKDPDEGNQEPTLILSGGGGFISSDVTVSSGSNLSFQISAQENSESNSKIQQVKVTRVFNNNPVVVLDTTVSVENFGPYTINAVAQNQAGAENWIFTVTDKDGESTSRTIKVTTTAPFAEKTGTFYHIGGSLKGAYDLFSDVQRSAGENNNLKDMRNSDQAGSTFTGSFTSLTATDFVEVTGSLLVNYDNPSQGGIAAAYAAGAKTKTITNPSENDVFVFNIRGTGNYGILKITDIDANNNDCNCSNKGKMTFTYKK